MSAVAVRGPLRVAVVSRHDLTRAGLTAVLASAPERVVVTDESAEVVVYDLAVPGHDDLRDVLTGVIPVLGVQPPSRPDLGEGALAMGVALVVPTTVTAAGLLDAVERAATRQRQDPAAVHAAARAALTSATGLTSRELDILALIAQGLGNHDIAARLFLSINSVKTYIRTAYRKIRVTSRSQAVLWAARHALVVVEPVRPDEDSA